MADLRLENYFMAFIVFTLIIVAGVGIIADVNTSYNVSMGQSTEFNTTYSRALKVYNSTYDSASNMESDVANANIAEDTTENSMFKGAFTAIRNSMGIFGIVTGLVNDIGSVIGVPIIFINMGIAAFLVILAMSLIYLVFRYRP